jgi:hypothetical protein
MPPIDKRAMKSNRDVNFEEKTGSSDKHSNRGGVSVDFNSTGFQSLKSKQTFYKKV